MNKRPHPLAFSQLKFLLPNKVLYVEIEYVESDRAFYRDLVDFEVTATNAEDEKDTERALVGASHELAEEYRRLGSEVPIELLLLRFFRTHLNSGTLKLLSSKDGPVLMTTNFKEYLGTASSDAVADAGIGSLLMGAVRCDPELAFDVRDIFISTTLDMKTVNRTLRYMEATGMIKRTVNGRFVPVMELLNTKRVEHSGPSLDRQRNRYYQAIKIQAKDPFCFVLMPFKEPEFSQATYWETIKPHIEQSFGISCYRVDEDQLPDRIDNKIYTYILRAAFVVAEITTENPNVMYELGLAHMIEKDVILITADGSRIAPFDLDKIRVFHYTSHDELKAHLSESICALGFKKKT